MLLERSWLGIDMSNLWRMDPPLWQQLDIFFCNGPDGCLHVQQLDTFFCKVGWMLACETAGYFLLQCATPANRPMMVV
jgi:hypothetical protein